MKIKSRVVTNILEDAEAMQERIAERARQLFHQRGGGGDPLQDWLTAERESLWRPAMEVVRTPDAFVIEAAVPGLDPKRIDLRVSAGQLLVSADVHHSDASQEGDVLQCEFATGPLFRVYRFPEPVEAGRVSAECRNGMLRVTAPIARPMGKVHITAA